MVRYLKYPLKFQSKNFPISYFISSSALGEAQAKITVYEKELTSAQKTIAKSKKALEVQQIIKDNESLQHKLRCQEEEFRLQNQTLLEELSKVRFSYLKISNFHEESLQ